MSNDSWGGMFDFNGDGKTTPDEELLGLALIEDEIKNNKDSVFAQEPSCKNKKTSYKKPPKPIPELVDASNYKSLCREQYSGIVGTIIALIILLLPAAVILSCAFSIYDPKSDASEFLVLLFSIAGFIYCGGSIYAAGKSINTHLNNLTIIKERYLASEQK